jgi:hypothetical protein
MYFQKVKKIGNNDQLEKVKSIIQKISHEKYIYDLFNQA